MQFDNMYEPRHRKLTAMGIARLVGTGHPDVLERLPTEICNMWTDVFGELREAVQRAADEEYAFRLGVFAPCIDP